MRLAGSPVVVMAALALTGCGSSCQDPTPTSESCAAQTLAGTVTDVTLGALDGDRFVAYADGDVVTRLFGGQGFPMLGFHLRVRGAELGDCIPQTTTVWRGDALQGSEGLPLVAEQVLADTWITGQALVIVFDVFEGDQVTVEAAVGGATSQVQLWVDVVGLVDAAVPADAMVPDAAAPVDAAAPDAAP